MSPNFISALLTVITLAVQATALTNDSRADNCPPHQSLNQDRPTFFTENKGQWDERVLYKADGAGGLTWFIERDGFTVLFSVADTTADQFSRTTGVPACPLDEEG